MRITTSAAVIAITSILLGLLGVGVSVMQTLPGVIRVPMTGLLILAALSFALAGVQHAVEHFRRGPIDLPRAGAPRRAWHLWRSLTETAVARQTQILLGLIYVLVCGPTWLAARLVGYRLLPRVGRTASTYWSPRDALTPESFRRQF